MKDFPDQDTDGKALIGLLARAQAGPISGLLDTHDMRRDFDWLREPEIDSVMVRGRAVGTGTLFKLGAMTVTRCTLRLTSGGVGHAWIRGRRKACAEAALVDALMQTDHAYNFACLDEQTKRMIRRAILKGLAIPGYQVPFASREMPMPYGWGTGGVHVSAAVMTPDDCLKVIDQCVVDTTNAASIHRFFERTAGVRTTTHTEKATVIQTRHRIPETLLKESQILVYQVPIPEPLRFLEPREQETRRMHSPEEYGLMHVKLYDDISRHGHIAASCAYPVRLEGRYVMDPSPIPKFDNPKLGDMGAIQLFGTGREQRICALPPRTSVVSLDFGHHPFDPSGADQACRHCGAVQSCLDEVITDDAGNRMFVCSDTDFCARTKAESGTGGTTP